MRLEREPSMSLWLKRSTVSHATWKILAGIHKRLSFLGIEIDAVHDGTADAILVGIRGLVGQMQREDDAKKVRRGMAGVVGDGHHAGGRAFGYRPVPGRRGELQIVEEEAEVVRRIFAAYAAGRPPREIAGDLNRDGIAPPRGASWNASTINGNSRRGTGIIFNELYVGRIVWNKVRMVKDPTLEANFPSEPSRRVAGCAGTAAAHYR